MVMSCYTGSKCRLKLDSLMGVGYYVILCDIMSYACTIQIYSELAQGGQAGLTYYDILHRKYYIL
jgi:hypothetical protein